MSSQGSADLQMDFAEEFEEQRGGETQSRHRDVVETLTKEDSLSSLSGAEVNGSPHTTQYTLTHTVTTFYGLL